jgi:CRISPR/Cas system CMR-associated protein Cmr3 (group 5 of RAMP superfamily)
MPTYEIRIEPIDPLLFGDNRSARAGMDHLQLDQDPSPFTLYGAIGQYLADRYRAGGAGGAGGSGKWPIELLGLQEPDVLEPLSPVSMAELLGYCSHDAGGGPYFPRPRHLRCTLRHGEPRPEDLLTPQEVGDVRTSARWPRLLSPAASHPPARGGTEGGNDVLEDEVEDDVVLSRSALGDVLCGEVPASAELSARLYRPEPRPGIAVDNESGTVFEGQLFTRPYRRFRPASCERTAKGTPAGFTAWLRTHEPMKLDLAESVGFLGGDRRRAHFEIDRCDEPLADLRDQVVQAVEQTDSRGFFLYLLTPAIESGAPVQARDGAGSLVAAALGKPAYASGWDVAKHQPREIQALVPAGSVYFFTWPPRASTPSQRADLVRSHWLRPLHGLHRLGAAAGFGRCLPGIWR